MGLVISAIFFVFMPGYLIKNLIFSEQWDNFIRKKREKKIINYNNEIKKFNEELKQNKIFESRHNDLQEVLSEFISQNCYSNTSPTLSYLDTPQIGASEHILYFKLKELYPEFILDFMKLDKYYPDISLKIDDKYFIDIEIDEPYVGNSGRPIHYIGIDDERNLFFQTKNWFVLRFSEQNIQENLEDCINIIDNLVQFLYTFNSKYLEQLSSVQDSIKVKRWSKQEGIIMSQMHTRDKYYKSKY